MSVGGNAALQDQRMPTLLTILVSLILNAQYYNNYFRTSPSLISRRMIYYNLVMAHLYFDLTETAQAPYIKSTHCLQGLQLPNQVHISLYRLQSN